MSDSTANPLEAVVADDARETRRGRYGWLSLVVAGLFGLLYAWNVWQAVGNLIGLPVFYDEMQYGAGNVPWWLLWVGVVIPIVFFVLAFVVGRRRNVGGKAVVFLVGLALTSGFGMGVLALEDVLRPVIVLVPQVN